MGEVIDREALIDLIENAWDDAEAEYTVASETGYGQFEGKPLSRIMPARVADAVIAYLSAQPDSHDRDSLGICRNCGTGLTAVDIIDGMQACQRNRDNESCPKCGGDRLRPDFTGSGRCHAVRNARGN